MGGSGDGKRNILWRWPNGTSKYNVSDARTLFFPDFLRALKMVRVIEGKII